MKVAIVTNNGKTVSHHIALSKKIAFYRLPEGELLEMADNPVMKRVKEEHIKLEKNPSGGRHLGTGHIIPEFLAQKGADLFVVTELGEGLKRRLSELGIRPIVAKSDNIDEILEQLKGE